MRQWKTLLLHFHNLPTVAILHLSWISIYSQNILLRSVFIITNHYMLIIIIINCRNNNGLYIKSNTPQQLRISLKIANPRANNFWCKMSADKPAQACGTSRRRSTLVRYRKT
ncbi:hypothetical protein NP493_286g02072 [Ridgeia piscesae]|uniref:Uncharacterized protein n=1 Tax=Ridgeia piscesae TaxID=27915 RepID=A0AAD9NX07_RIDPI|nr:hypothetical protein NP493_286g02072 [Ridgeia piscesae]